METKKIYGIIFLVAFFCGISSQSFAKSKKVPVTCIWSISNDPDDFDGTVVALCKEQYEEPDAEFQCNLMGGMPHYKRLMGKHCKKLGFRKSPGAKLLDQPLRDYLNRESDDE